MAVTLEWLGVAEASAEDSRGAISLIGVNQNVILAETLPVSRTRAVVLLLQEIDGPGPLLGSGTHVAIQIGVVDPEGETLTSARHSIDLGERKYPDLPGGISLVAQLQVTFQKYGTYRLRCSVELPDDVVLNAEKAIHVIQAS